MGTTICKKQTKQEAGRPPSGGRFFRPDRNPGREGRAIEILSRPQARPAKKGRVVFVTKRNAGSLNPPAENTRFLRENISPRKKRHFAAFFPRRRLLRAPFPFFLCIGRDLSLLGLAGEQNPFARMRYATITGGESSGCKHRKNGPQTPNPKIAISGRRFPCPRRTAWRESGSPPDDVFNVTFE